MQEGISVKTITSHWCVNYLGHLLTIFGLGAFWALLYGMMGLSRSFLSTAYITNHVFYETHCYSTQ